MHTENHYTSRLAVDLGTMDYAECLALQKDMVRKRVDEAIPDTLLFVDHPSVYTIGRKADSSNFPGIDVIRTERGGDVTYHGPGQLVVYPIMKLWEEGKVDIKQLVREVTGAVIDLLSYNGYRGYLGDEPGIWVEGRKVASVGMAVESGVTYHGVAINLSSVAVEGFSRIRPCGLSPDVMSYVPISRETAIEGLIRAFTERFGEFRFVRLNHDSLPILFLVSCRDFKHIDC